MNKVIRLELAAVLLATFAAVAAEPVKVKTVAELKSALSSAVNGTCWEDGQEILLASNEYDFAELGGVDAQSGSYLKAVKKFVKIRPESVSDGKVTFKGCGTSTSLRAFYVSSPTWVEGIVFTNFSRGTIAANNGGGAVYVQNCSAGEAVFTNCTFIDCTTLTKTSTGCAIQQHNSLSPYIVDCSFHSCTGAGAVVGGVYGGNNSVVVKCQFYGCNDILRYGALSNCWVEGCSGVVTTSASSIDGCVFTNNTVNGSHYITATRLTHSDLYFCSNPVIAGARESLVNNAIVDACRFVCCTNGGKTLKACKASNSLFDRCSHDGRTSLAYTFADSVLVNCTVTGNRTLSALFNGSPMVATNCIFVGNSHKIPTMRLEHCIHDGLANNATLTGEGNEKMATADILKMFVGDGPDPYQLRSKHVAAVDNGAEVGWWPDATDLRGETRVIGPAVDIGCYEYRPKGLMLLLK